MILYSMVLLQKTLPFLFHEFFARVFSLGAHLQGYWIDCRAVQYDDVCRIKEAAAILHDISSRRSTAWLKDGPQSSLSKS